MANLKGSTFDKQIKDMQIRLEARGTKKIMSNHKTHSNALADKRDMYIQDFAKFATQNKFEGKLNQFLNQENMTSFLEQRIKDLSKNSAENYISGWNSLLNALAEVNISHDISQNYLNDYWKNMKNLFNEPTQNNQRGLGNVADKIITNLYEKRYESGVIAELQYRHGFRVSEALEIAKNYNRYIKDNIISGVVGKGGHIYKEKEISPNLLEKLKHTQDIPSLSTYNRDLEKVANISSHDFRYEFAKNLYEKMLDSNITHHQALKETSEEMNHHRENITSYYLTRL